MINWKKNLWILWVTQIISLMSFGFGLPFIPYYIKELEVLTDTSLKVWTTVLAAAPAITMGIMAPIWGYLADRYGRKLMIMRAMFFAVFVIGGMGLVQSVNQLLILRLMQGLFTGTVTAAIAFVASNTPQEDLTYALGVISSSTFIGYSIGPLIGGQLADLLGYRMSFIIGGGLMLIGGLLVLILVKEDKSTLVPKHSEHQDSFIEKYKKILVPSILLFMSMMFLLRIGRTIFSPYLPLLVENKFPDRESVAGITGAISAFIGFATGLSGIVIARISKRFDKLKMASLLLLAAGLVSIGVVQYADIGRWLTQVFAIHVANDIYVFTGLFIVFYFIIGGVEPLITSSAAMAVKAEDRGALFGFQGMIGSLAWFVAPTLAGPIVVAYDIESVLKLIPVVLAANIIISLVVGRISRGRNTSVK